MKQIFNHSICLSFDDGKTWENTELYMNWLYLEQKFAVGDVAHIDTYDKARAFVRASLIPNAAITHTIFGRECIDIVTMERLCGIRMTPRRFRPFQIKSVYEPVAHPETLPITTLIGRLSLRDLTEYLKNSGISFPIAQNNIQEADYDGT